MQAENYRSNCPINLAVEVIGDKWSLLIVRDLMFEDKLHFRELMDGEEKIASNILTDRLARLETEGVITKKNDPSHKQKYIYNLTAKGIDLLPVIIELGNWSLKYQPVDLKRFPHAKQLARADKDAIQKLKKDLLKKHQNS
ncbi:MAG TPA: helix-turn-helix domain-containing protein [Puia sp.]|nr:helix-turn-helix domain-containing protein [Puia sp.]